MVGLDTDPAGTAAWVPQDLAEWPEAHRKHLPRSYGFAKGDALVTIGHLRFIDDPWSFEEAQFLGSFATDGTALRARLKELAQSPAKGELSEGGTTLSRQDRQVVLSVERVTPLGNVTVHELAIKNGGLVCTSERGTTTVGTADRRGVRAVLAEVPALGMVHRAEITRIEVADGWFSSVGQLAETLQIGPRGMSLSPGDEMTDEWFTLCDVSVPEGVDPSPVFINGIRWAITELTGTVPRDALLPTDGVEDGWLIPCCSHLWASLSADETASRVSGTAFLSLGLATPHVAVAINDLSSWGDVSVRAWSSSPKLRLREISRWIDTVDSGLDYRGGVGAYARQLAKWSELRFSSDDTLELHLGFDASQDELRSIVDWESADIWTSS
jgi:hypothetical protein